MYRVRHNKLYKIFLFTFKNVVFSYIISFIHRWKLFGGTVPPNKPLFGRTVPPNKLLFGGTLPMLKFF